MTVSKVLGVPGELPPPLALMEMILGKWVSQAIHAAAELGIADLLKDGPRSSPELAAETKCDEDSLYRLLRALASVEVLVEEPDRRFALTATGQFLRSDVPGSLRAWARMTGSAPTWKPWGEIVHSVRTGEPAFEKVFGEDGFVYYEKHPEHAAVFDEAMTAISGMEAEAVAAAYDFSSVDTLADVGGGRGFLLGTLLRTTPSLRGILFDLPHVVRGAASTLERFGVADRCRVEPGSFFDTAPAGADAIAMKHILHDWDDDACVRILERCRAGLPSEGRLLVIEAVIPTSSGPDFGKLLDLEMLIQTPRGRERTEEEYRRLLARAGFRLDRVVPTPSPVSVVEAFRD